MRKSLEEIHRTIPILKEFSKWRKILAFTGPGYLIAVGYMDPGNWATDLAGGSRFGYALLSVVLISGLMAMLLQHLALKLGVVMERDLAQACHDHYPPWARKVLWIMAEIAITACDLAEVIGSAIALNLLFHLPIIIGVGITAFDTLLLLFLQNKGLRYLEAVVVSLIVVIIASFGIEIFFSAPDIWQLLTGFIPSSQLVTNRDMLYIGIGIMGATVMPHNLYLHSALVQSRDFGASRKNKKEAITLATLDSNIALTAATVVNSAILIVSAATFFTRNIHSVVEIQDAHRLLTPLLGTGLASALFAVALLASGHNSTITGTLAGQVVMEGFIDLHIKPWQRRLITRLLAIIPAIIIVWLYGSHGLAKLLIFSQVVLSMQLPFAVVPLVLFTGNRKYMGHFTNTPAVSWVSWIVTAAIIFFNVWLIFRIVGGV
jgi:manganese transport protein